MFDGQTCTTWRSRGKRKQPQLFLRGSPPGDADAADDDDSDGEGGDEDHPFHSDKNMIMMNYRIGHLPIVEDWRIDVHVEDVVHLLPFIDHRDDGVSDDDNLGVADDSHGDGRGEHPAEGDVAAHLKS